MKIAKYKAIKRHIREQIRSGKLHAGDRVPSEYELVDQLGVGRSQARQALRELEIEGFLVRRQGSGSFVAPNAGFRWGQVADAPRTVAVAFPNYDSGYIREVVESFMEAVFAVGYGVTNYSIQLTEEDEVRFLENVLESGMSGLLVWLGNETDKIRDALVHLSSHRFPVVMVDRYFPDVDLDCVVSDNEQIGYALTKALIARGHTRIGVVYSSVDTATSQTNRIAGYERAMKEAGLEADDTMRVVVDYIDENLSASVDRAMAPKEHATAFLCINDIIASYLQRELDRLKYAVPDDVELATVDDGVSPGVAGLKTLSLRQNGAEIGKRAAELMLARLENFDQPAQHICVPPGNVVEAAIAAKELDGAQKGGG